MDISMLLRVLGYAAIFTFFIGHLGWLYLFSNGINDYEFQKFYFSIGIIGLISLLVGITRDLPNEVIKK